MSLGKEKASKETNNEQLLHRVIEVSTLVLRNEGDIEYAVGETPHNILEEKSSCHGAVSTVFKKVKGQWQLIAGGYCEECKQREITFPLPPERTNKFVTEMARIQKTPINQNVL